MFHKSFQPAKCKTALNLAKSRIKLMKNKKDVQMRQLRRGVAQLLQNGQDQTARIRVEHVVREEKMLAAYEMIEIYCELIVARLPIIETQKNCPLDLKEAITSLIFAAPRCGDIPELQDVRKHFIAKYGKDFATAAIEIRPACGVSRTLVEKLSVKAPDGPTKVKILKGIAEEHNIQWEPNWFKDEDLVSSDDTPKKLHADNYKIQMEPLNVQIADDLEERHPHGTQKLENSSQRHPHTNVTEIPPSPTSPPAIRPSGNVNVSVAMLFSQSSGTAKNAFSAEGQNWNMEFKDATAAAQAAAESAERASMAARAAAELSIRDSYGRGQSSVHDENEGDRHYAGSEQGTPINRSFNQRRPSMKGHQGTTNQQGVITERRDVRSSNHDARQQEFRESESTSHRVKEDSIRQSRDPESTPSTSKDDYNWSNSSNIQEYETEPAENPFHGETVESQNQPSNFFPQSSGFGDEYDTFSNLKYRSDEIDTDSSFDAFGQGISEEENWHAKTIYVSKSSSFKDETISRDYGERNVFRESDENNDEFDSGTGVFVGTDKRGGLDFTEKVEHNVANAVFDEYGSDDGGDDDDDDDDDECKLSPKHALLQKDKLSDSFRNSSIYSKLIEPLPVTFDDYDISSPRSEKGLKTENTEPEIGSYNYRKPDWDSQVTTGSIGSSFVEGGTDDSSVSNEHMEENQNLFVGSLDEGKAFESPRSFRLHLESKYRSEFDGGTYSAGGMELNFGSLPGGRRNKPSWLSQFTRDGYDDVSSPSPEAAINDGFRESGDSSTDKFHGSSDRMDCEDSNIPERSYTGSIHENVNKASSKDRTGDFNFDDSSPEENIPIPVIDKHVQGSGISRRTKGSTKTGRVSSSSYAPEDSFKSETETTNSGSRMIGQSSGEDSAPFELRSGTKASRNEKPETPTSTEIQGGSVSTEKAFSRVNSAKKPSHVHPKLPDFETFTAHLQSLRTNRQ